MYEFLAIVLFFLLAAQFGVIAILGQKNKPVYAFTTSIIAGLAPAFIVSFVFGVLTCLGSSPASHPPVDTGLLFGGFGTMLGLMLPLTISNGIFLRRFERNNPGRVYVIPYALCTSVVAFVGFCMIRSSLT